MHWMLATATPHSLRYPSLYSRPGFSLHRKAEVSGTESSWPPRPRSTLASAAGRCRGIFRNSSTRSNAFSSLWPNRTEPSADAKRPTTTASHAGPAGTAMRAKTPTSEPRQKSNMAFSGNGESAWDAELTSG